MKRVKLSLPQSRFLETLSKSGDTYAIDSWPPVRKLAELGFVKKNQNKWQERWRITESGSAWLKGAQ